MRKLGAIVVFVFCGMFNWWSWYASQHGRGLTRINADLNPDKSSCHGYASPCTYNPAYGCANRHWGPALEKDRLYRSPAQLDGSSEIYVVNADGGGLSPLANEILPNSTPAWSPDGSKIAFSNGDGGDTASICIMISCGWFQNPVGEI